jgi:hypothetical protein
MMMMLLMLRSYCYCCYTTPTRCEDKTLMHFASPQFVQEDAMFMTDLATTEFGLMVLVMVVAVMVTPRVLNNAHD